MLLQHSEALHVRSERSAPGISAGVSSTSGTPEATAMVHAVTCKLFLQLIPFEVPQSSSRYRLTSAQFNVDILYIKAQVH